MFFDGHSNESLCLMARSSSPTATLASERGSHSLTDSSRSWSLFRSSGRRAGGRIVPGGEGFRRIHRLDCRPELTLCELRPKIAREGVLTLHVRRPRVVEEFPRVFVV